jgi:hypothetical protein
VFVLRQRLDRCLAHLHRLNYHRGYHPRWTAHYISSIVARQVGGVRVDSMASQMVTFPTFMILEAGQTFTVGAFTWTTGVNGTAAIMEATRVYPAPTESTPTPTDPISRSPAPASRHPSPRCQRRQLDDSDLVESIDRVTEGLVETLTLVEAIRDQPTKNGRKPAHHHWTERPARASRQRHPDSDLMITATPRGRTVHYRPVPLADLRSEGRETPMDQLHAPGLDSPDLPEAGRPVPIVNMVRIEEVRGSRLPLIPKESSRSTQTQTEDYEEVFPPFPPGFGGMIFNISADEPTVDGEMEQDRDARVARNTHRHEHRARADAVLDAGGRHRVHRDLSNAFDMCGNHQVHRTPPRISPSS